MNVKLKMSMLASILAFAAAGQANATIVGTAAPGSDLVLTVFDATTDSTYTRDLSINMTNFVAGVTGTASTLKASAASVGNLSYAADGNWTSFMSGVGGSDSLSWNISAAKTVTGTSFMGQELLITAPTTVAVTPTANLNSSLTSIISNYSLYYSNASGLQGTASSDVNTGGTLTYITGADAHVAGNDALTANAGWKFATTGTAFGQNLDFYFITPSSTSGIAKVAAAQFGAANGGDVWTLASNGTLSYTVAAVPEASEWMLMLSGFGLIGFIASRRKNSGAALTFA